MSTNNDHNNNDKTVRLEISEKQKAIITRSVFAIDTQDVILSLNHKYESTKIIFTIEAKWQKVHKVLTETAKKCGITDEADIHLLLSHVDDNSELIRESKSQEQDEKTTRKSQADHLYEVFQSKLAETKLFKDEFNIPHALVLIDDHYQVLPIVGTEFRRYLSRLYYDSFEKVPNTEAVKNVVNQIEGKAFYEGETTKLHLRCGWSNDDTRDTIYYDMSDDKYRTVKIAADEGWQIVDKQTEVLFRRFNHQLPQVQPVPLLPAVMASLKLKIDDVDAVDDDFTHFMDLLNIKNPDDHLLMKCYIISLFIPGIPHVILMLLGEQGGAKTTLQELVRSLVDPSIIGTLSLPSNKDDVIQQLSHHYVTYYDNVSYIPTWMSDTFCRAATGSSSSKRTLFTTDDEFYYNFMRIVGINSIDLAVMSPDLEDRSITFKPERLAKSDRKRIAEIWKEFNELKPRLLTYIFDILAKALAYKKKHGDIEFVDGLNRMADWEAWAEIISRCMGNPDGKLQTIYTENINRQVDDAIASSQLCQAVLELRKQLVNGVWNTIPVNPKTAGKWESTPTELHDKLTTIARDNLKFTNLNSRKYWPQSAAALTHYLNKVKTLLRVKGLEVITKERDENGDRVIRMIDLDLDKKLLCNPQTSQNDRQDRQDRQQTENQAQNDPKKIDDLSNGDSKRSSTENGENPAQNQGFDDVDDDLGAFAGDMKKNISVNDDENDIDIYNQRPYPRPPGYYDTDPDMDPDMDPDDDDPDADAEDMEPIV